MSKTAYVVTQGEYSDYSIVGVFTKKCVADKAAKLFGGDVEEYPMNTSMPKVYQWFCRVKTKTGEVESVESWDLQIDQSTGQDAMDNYYAMGATREEAIKNAQDYRATQLALKEGI